MTKKTAFFLLFLCVIATQVSCIKFEKGLESNVLSFTGGSASFDFGMVQIGQQKEHTFIVNNTGLVPLTSTSEIVLSAPFSLVGTSCMESILPGGSCSVIVRFTPTEENVSNVTASITFTDSESEQTIEFSVSGSGSKAPVPLAIVLMGRRFGLSSPPQSTPLTVPFESRIELNWQIVGGNAEACSLSSTTSSTFISNALAISSTVTAPLSQNDTFIFNCRDVIDSTTVSRSLMVTVLPPDPDPVVLLTVSPTSPYDYQSVEVGQSKPQTFNLTNAGNVDIEIASISGWNGIFSKISDTCGGVLEPGQACAIGTQFTPTEARDDYATTYGIIYEGDGQSKALLVNVKGTGTITPVEPEFPLTSNLGASYQQGAGTGATLDFGEVNIKDGSKDLTVTFTNQGTRTLSDFDLEMQLPFSFVSSDCGGSIAGGASCNAIYRFAPRMGSGSISKVVTLAYEPADSPRKDYMMKFTGVATLPEVWITSDLGENYDAEEGTGAQIDFGRINDEASQSFTFTNKGSQAATLTDVTGSSPFEASTSDCDSPIATGNSCTMNIHFAPEDRDPHLKVVPFIFAVGGNTVTFHVKFTGKRKALGGGPEGED